jgi:two-component system sensor histidine kinase AlgZ
VRKSSLEANLWARMGRPVGWLTILAFAMPFIAIRFFIFWKEGMSHPVTLAGAALVPIFVSIGFAWISPMPWRYTGDDRPRPGLFRGAIQAVLANSVAVLLFVEMDVPVIAISRPMSPSAFWTAAAWNAAMLIPLMTLVGYFIATGEVQDEDRRRSDAQSKSAQDRALQHQLSPHVLFNALNGLAELVRQDPAAAEQGLLDLAELYRTVLDNGRLQWVPLREEARLVERFLAVEKLRLGDRLHVVWEWDDELNGLMVPSLVLQPLVENAIKHGLSQRVGNSTVYIVARVVLGDVEIRVDNQCELEASAGRPGRKGRQGVGLENLEERLKLHFPGTSSVFLESDDGYTRAGFRVDAKALGVPVHKNGETTLTANESWTSLN